MKINYFCRKRKIAGLEPDDLFGEVYARYLAGNREHSIVDHVCVDVLRGQGKSVRKGGPNYEQKLALLNPRSYEEGNFDSRCGVSPIKAINHKIDVAKCMAILDGLTIKERKKEIFTLYFCHDLKMKAIGRKFGITESRASQIVDQVTLAIRKAVENPKPVDIPTQEPAANYFLMTKEEAVEASGLTVLQIGAYIRHGKIKPVFKRNEPVRIRSDELDAVVNSRLRAKDETEFTPWVRVRPSADLPTKVESKDNVVELKDHALKARISQRAKELYEMGEFRAACEFFLILGEQAS